MKFIDALYGAIDLNLLPSLLCLPELQRLREVRLCNVNSPFITGGANINRFEHAIGTAYLSNLFCDTNKVTNDRTEFFIASLLHDIVTGPFGHSLEYLFETLGKNEYEHAQLDTIFKGKTVQSSRPYYMGKKSILISKNDIVDIAVMRDILLGKHALSKFLDNIIDIDNIDNVFRFAYHVGIKFNHNVPKALARELAYKNDFLIFTSKNISFFTEWYNTRKKLYKYLLEDPGEFVAKALLERVFIELIKDDVISEVDWILVDFNLVNKALEFGNATAKSCIQRYMLMDFPKIQSIYYLKDYQKLDNLLHKEKLNLIEQAFNGGVYLHFIRDVNKTQRPLIGIDQQDNIQTIGKKNDRYLIGFFAETQKSISLIRQNFENIIGEGLININNDVDINKKELSLF